MSRARPACGIEIGHGGMLIDEETWVVREVGPNELWGHRGTDHGRHRGGRRARMMMDLDRVGFESEPKRITWAPNDCSLYALSLGSGFDELAFVAEEAIGHPSTRLSRASCWRGSWPASRPPGPIPASIRATTTCIRSSTANSAWSSSAASSRVADVMVRTRVAGHLRQGIGSPGRARRARRPSGSPASRSSPRSLLSSSEEEGGLRRTESTRATSQRNRTRSKARLRDRLSDPRYPDVCSIDTAATIPHPIHLDPEVARRGGMRGPDPDGPQHPGDGGARRTPSASVAPSPIPFARV